MLFLVANIVILLKYTNNSLDNFLFFLSNNIAVDPALLVILSKAKYLCIFRF